LGANEVGVKGRAERIAPPADAGRVAATAVEQRVVHGHDQGGLRIELSNDAAAHDSEQIFGGEALLGEKTIGAGPIERAFAGGVDPAADGMAAKADEVAQGEAFEPPGDAGLAALEAFLEESLELLEEPRRGVFFREEGGA